MGGEWVENGWRMGGECGYNRVFEIHLDWTRVSYNNGAGESSMKCAAQLYLRNG